MLGTGIEHAMEPCVTWLCLRAHRVWTRLTAVGITGSDSGVGKVWPTGRLAFCLSLQIQFYWTQPHSCDGHWLVAACTSQFQQKEGVKETTVLAFIKSVDPRNKP